MTRFLPIFVFFALILVCFSYLPVKREIVYRLGISGDTTSSCCNVADITRSAGNFDENSNLAIFEGNTVDYPKTSLAQANIPESSDQSQVLGTTNSAGEEKWIDVNLATQTLTAYEGSKVIMQFLISSGRWFATPKGTFNIWYKTRYQTMKGGSAALGTYYNLPNVPDNMFFNGGFAIHGAYWHNNFGHPMSHGCVNAPLAQVHQLFEWTGPAVPSGVNAIKASAENPGTRVVIH